jgi:hypothetical protein
MTAFEAAAGGISREWLYGLRHEKREKQIPCAETGTRDDTIFVALTRFARGWENPRKCWPHGLWGWPHGL